MNEEQKKNEPINPDDLSRENRREMDLQSGPLDTSPQLLSENWPSLHDRMQARQSGLYGSRVSESEQGPEAVAEEQEVVDALEDAKTPVRSHDTIMKRRWRKFKSLKRGYYSFILLLVLYVLSFFLPLIANNQPLMVSYQGNTYFPAFADLVGEPYYPWTLFGRESDESPVDFRELEAEWEASGSDEGTLIMPIYGWNPLEGDYSEGVPPNEPSASHPLGTDNRGRDVLSRMLYGFNVSISFGIGLTILTFLIGTIIGSMMGYFGGKFDLFTQRVIEIWQVLPGLYVIIIVSSILTPNFIILILILTTFGWMGMTYFMRGEFYREKAKDYVAAAISLGTKDSKIIFSHILPNALTPLIATFPFAVIAGITSLVSLDFLGYGLPEPTPSWGEMISQGTTEFSGNFQNWWLVIVPTGFIFVTLLMVTFIGEALREAFDPKVFSRLR